MGIGALLATGVAVFWFMTDDGSIPAYAAAIAAGICFGIPFIIGRAALYVLAGK